MLHPTTLDADQNEGNCLNHLAAWHQKTAFDAAVALQNRSLSAQAYLGACLDQIDAREPEVHAFAHIAREGAMARAKALDAGMDAHLAKPYSREQLKELVQRWL